jgi:hypothetical protein
MRKKRRLVAHGDYCSIANCWIKIPAIFRGMFGIFRDISRRLIVYFKNSHGTLVAKTQQYKDYNIPASRAF